MKLFDVGRVMRTIRRRRPGRARDLESAGIDMMWVAELYSYDPFRFFGYPVRITSPEWH